MKNYIVSGLHRIDSTEKWLGVDIANKEDFYANYDEMSCLSKNSCFHFVAGDWEYIRLESTATDICHAFRQQFRAIWDLWSAEPCNIYYVGADVLIMQPVEIFGKYKHFMLFNYNTLKSTDEFEHYLNMDIRYYPAEMNRTMFEQALTESEQAINCGDIDNIYNRMLWSQGLDPETVIDPLMAYQLIHIPKTPQDRKLNDQWNNCSMENSFVVHCCGTPQQISIKVPHMERGVRALGILDSVETIKTIDISNLP